MSLWWQFQRHRGRKLRKWAHYFDVYERHLSRFVGRPCVFLEIGVAGGGSLQMWQGWLGPSATIVGVDHKEGCKVFDDPDGGVHVRIGDASDPEFLASVVAEFGAPDVVIDDGSHVASQVTATFGWLYERTSPAGVYVVEDVHTSYYPDGHEGGLRRPGTMVELAKDLVDELHADWCDELEPSAFTRSTVSMHVYDSVLVFERGLHPVARVVSSGRGSSRAPKPGRRGDER